jgi:hypothetical protein
MMSSEPEIRVSEIRFVLFGIMPYRENRDRW